MVNFDWLSVYDFSTLSTYHLFWWCLGSNLGPCIYYVLSLPTELSSQRHLLTIFNLFKYILTFFYKYNFTFFLKKKKKKKALLFKIVT